ncbi:MAG: hypothetical protein KME38_29055 [Spirirestis rafaelensis WJT71-NPBG6]|jgi:hypothetical protein|nr:hypothetical protein [Spirirestis rafaelensis WJT71-NPBG6]
MNHKKKFTKRIIALNHPETQAFLLRKYIRDRKLTPALNLLEKKGIYDDLARFVITAIQHLEEAL